ncbi:MAG: hypothetical protein FWF51_01470 [Chitinivibrionia bacterium]|nr:hypothetical protein [Chitinivibrionia bacterium]
MKTMEKHTTPAPPKEGNKILAKEGNNKKLPKEETPKKQLAQVFHFDLYGKREEKYNFLLNNSLQTVPWQELKPTEPYYFFVPKDFSLQSEYEQGFSVKELFPVNSVGIVTARDNFTVHYTVEAVKKHHKRFY